jgi:hypothetical protein
MIAGISAYKEIFRPVVGRVTIDMMNYLRFCYGSADCLFSDKYMLINKTPPV